MNVRRAMVLVVTIAKVNRSPVPARCNVKKFHVWRWEQDEADSNNRAPVGSKCQCGLLTQERQLRGVAPPVVSPQTKGPTYG